jgi:hypothetical protein
MADTSKEAAGVLSSVHQETQDLHFLIVKDNAMEPQGLRIEE